MASGQEPANIQLVLTNAAETKFADVPFERSTNVISGGAKAAPTGATYDAIPVMSFYGKNGSLWHGKRLVVRAISEATDIIESEESQGEIPVKYIDEKTGQVVGSTTLTFETMTGFTAGGTVDITCTAGVPTRVSYQDAPQGLHFALDPQGKARVYLGDDA